MPADSSFAARLAAARAATGLSAGQLGVARVFDSAVFLKDATGPLLSEEVLVKDLQQVAGQLVSMGSIHQEFVAEQHDSAVTRLLTSGAVLVGASATAEFGTVAYTEPVGQDVPVNPLHPGMMVGGSSGGSAVAVSRGLVRVAHATDGGGSIRVPAAATGLVGLKPAHDNSVGGFTPLAHGFLADGFESTRRAYGLSDAPMHSAEAGPVSSQSSASSQSVPQGLRVGYTNKPFHHDSTVNPQVAAATAGATALLTTTDLVSSVTAAPPPYSPSQFELFANVIAARCADLPEPLSPITAWLKEQGKTVPGWRRKEMETAIHNLREHTLQQWAELDVVATPMLACAPPPPGTFSQLEPRLNFWAQTAWTPWGTLWNLTGWASVTVPLVDPARLGGSPGVGSGSGSGGSTGGRWPIALQLGAVSGRASESDLLALAEAVQDVVRVLPPEDLSIAEPGDIEQLNYMPHPAVHDHSTEPRHEH